MTSLSLAPLTADEWRPMTDREHVAYAEELAEAEVRGFARGAAWAKAECLADHATIANRIDAAARAFYLLEADDLHRTEVKAA